MASKNIAITELAYELLSRYKTQGQSFSEVIVSHFKKKKHLLDYAGIWADMPENEWKKFETDVQRARKEMSASFKKRREALKL